MISEYKLSQPLEQMIQKKCPSCKGNQSSSQINLKSLQKMFCSMPHSVLYWSTYFWIDRWQMAYMAPRQEGLSRILLGLREVRTGSDCCLNYWTGLEPGRGGQGLAWSESCLVRTQFVWMTFFVRTCVANLYIGAQCCIVLNFCFSCSVYLHRSQNVYTVRVNLWW